MDLQTADFEASFSVISKWFYVCLLGLFVLLNIHSHSLILTLKFLSRTMSKNFHGPLRIFYPFPPPPPIMIIPFVWGFNQSLSVL